MAVSLTVPELAGALRVGSSSQETTEMTRLLAYTTEAVTRHAPDAPTAVSNEATIRLAGYLFDQPDWTRNSTGGDPLRNSGAMRILNPWRIHRAGNIALSEDEEETSMATSVQPTTVGSVTVTNTPTDITSGLAAGAYRGHPFHRGASVDLMWGVLVAYSPNPPTDPDHYFYVRPDDSFDFRSPGPVWVRTDRADYTASVTVVRVGA